MKKLKVFWNNIAVEEKLLALYIIAFFNTEVSIFSIGAKKILFTDVIFLILLAIYLWKLAKGKWLLPATYLLKPLVVMVVLFMFSFLNSVNLMDSFIEIFGLIYLITLFIIIQHIITTPKKLNWFLYLWVITACGISLIGLFGFYAGMINKDLISSNLLFYDTITSMAHHYPRIDSTFANANMLCTYLHVSLIFACILFLLEANPKRKSLIAMGISILVLTALLTGSRRFTGLLLSAFIILLIFGQGRQALLLKRVCLIGFCLFLIASFITSIWVVFPIEIKNDKAAKTITATIDYKYSIHFIQPIAAINMFKKHPIIGVGLGTFNRHFKESVDWEWLRSSFGFKAYPNYVEPVENKTLSLDPHSVFLGTLAETGIIGFTGLIYFLLKYLGLLIKRFKEARNFTFEKVLSGCLLAGFIGFLLNGLTLDMLSMRHFWFMIAIGLSCIQKKQ